MKKYIVQPGQRVIFLNVDGVLTNASRYWLPRKNQSEVLDPTALALISQFCEKFNAVVVMASAWSVTYDTVEAWQQLFESVGANIPVVDVLPLGRSWLLDARAYMADMPDVSWVLFEDDACPPPGAQDIVSVKKAVGLTTAHLELAAQFIAPGSEELKDLRELNRAFRHQLF